MNVHLKERPYKCRYGCEVGKTFSDCKVAMLLYSRYSRSVGLIFENHLIKAVGVNV